MSLVDYEPDSDNDEKSFSGEQEKKQSIEKETPPATLNTNLSSKETQSKKRVVDFVLPISIKSLQQSEDDEEEPKERPKKRLKSNVTIFDVLPQPKSSQAQQTTTTETTPLTSTEQRPLQQDKEVEDKNTSQEEREETEENFFGILKEKNVSIVSTQQTKDTLSQNNKPTKEGSEEQPLIGPPKPPSLVLSATTPSTSTSPSSSPPQSQLSTVPSTLPPLPQSYPYPLHIQQNTLVYTTYPTYMTPSLQSPQTPPQQQTTSSSSVLSLIPPHELHRKSFEIPESEEIVEVSGAELLKDRAPNPLIRDTSAIEQHRLRAASTQGKPSLLQKRKHQIHYLAWEAKQRELELIERKSQAIRTKQETQSKYGW